MADYFFSIDDLGIYTDHFFGAAPGYVGLDPVVQKTIDRVQSAVDAFKAFRGQAQDSRADVKTSLRDMRELRTRVRTRLDSFFHHLVASRSSVAFEMTRIFPTENKGDSGKSNGSLSAALARAIEGLEKYPEIPNAQAWLDELKGYRAQFDPKFQEVSSRDSGKRQDSAGFKAARQRCEREYRAAVKIFDGLLMQAEREEELSGIFLHLQRPGGRKKSEGGEAEAAGETEPAGAGTGTTGSDATAAEPAGAAG